MAEQGPVKPPKTRVCNKCRKRKPRIAFYTHRRSGREHQPSFKTSLHPWCKTCSSIANKKHYTRNREKRIAAAILVFQELRERVLKAYGNKCACCGEKHKDFLTIDHVGGGGNHHRREIGGWSRMYVWLENNGYPKRDYRCLCMNCNWAQRYGKACPHKRKK